ncbi:hypothetical protein [Thiohalocapsa sp.]|uniref:hypothetical protein n=1 Tax=Thiohalocapsa sp. TaxID=2497641 RepID=UPI0025E48C1E|nr:hypothetical protein [Thiohalocapsa sp.]
MGVHGSSRPRVVPEPAIDYRYDEGLYGLGRLTGIDSGDLSLGYAYHARGTLAEATQTLAGIRLTVAYDYDAADQLTGITYPSGRQVTFRPPDFPDSVMTPVFGNPSAAW